MIVSYAQALEDVVLFRALGHIRDGFYIDVGANDPVVDSVTRLFYERGWRGVNIEPSPHWFQKVVADRNRDINLNIVVSDKAGVCTFYEIEGTGLSSIFEDVTTRYDSTILPRKSYEVETQTLASICELHAPETIHFLKVDVEGAEEMVLKGANFQRYRPWIVLVEATEPMSSNPSHFAWDPLMTQADYEFVLFDGLNRFYLAKEKADLKPYFYFKGDTYKTIEAIWTEGHWRKIAEEKMAEIDQIKSSRWWKSRERILDLVGRRRR